METRIFPKSIFGTSNTKLWEKAPPKKRVNSRFFWTQRLIQDIAERNVSAKFEEKLSKLGSHERGYIYVHNYIGQYMYIYVLILNTVLSFKTHVVHQISG